MPRSKLENTLEKFLNKSLMPKQASQLRQYASNNVNLGKDWADEHLPATEKLTYRHALAMMNAYFDKIKPTVDRGIANMETALGKKRRDDDELRDTLEHSWIIHDTIAHFQTLAKALGIDETDEPSAVQSVMHRDQAQDLTHGTTILSKASGMFGRVGQPAPIRELIEIMAEVDFPPVADAARAFLGRAR